MGKEKRDLSRREKKKTKMGCLSDQPTFSFSNLFNRLRCMFACCGGTISIRNVDMPDGGKPPRRRRWYKCWGER